MIRSSDLTLIPELTRPETPLRRDSAERLFSSCKLPEVIVIGASTGGPQALDILLRGMANYINEVYVLVVLHTLAELIAPITQHVENLTSIPAQSAVHNGELRKGIIYFAPGGYHLGLVAEGQHIKTFLSQSAPENFCRPSVDFLFRSTARILGEHVLGVVLTGMGSDGLAGASAIVEAGGHVIAQDKTSSVVWGMPGAIVDKNLALAVLPVELIAPAIGILLRLKGNKGAAHGV